MNMLLKYNKYIIVLFLSLISCNEEKVQPKVKVQTDFDLISTNIINTHFNHIRYKDEFYNEVDQFILFLSADGSWSDLSYNSNEGLSVL
jgi:hypothetical protein